MMKLLITSILQKMAVSLIGGRGYLNPSSDLLSSSLLITSNNDQQNGLI